MATDVIVGPRRKGFLDLPAEIRIDIYRKAFKSTKSIRCGELTSSRFFPFFEQPRLAQLSSQFLRSCATVHAEAKPVLFQLAGTCSPRIQALSYRGSALTINKTRVRELKSLPCLKAVTISSCTNYLDVSSTDLPGPIARAYQGHMNQLHSCLGELMRTRPDIQFDIVSRGSYLDIDGSRDIVRVHFDINLAEDGITPTPSFIRILDETDNW